MPVRLVLLRIKKPLTKKQPIMLQNFYVRLSSKAIIEAAFIPDCSNNAGKLEAAGMHTITDLRYQHMIRYFFGTNPPVHNIVSYQDIKTLLTTEVSPGVMPTHLEFEWNTTTNVIAVRAKDGNATDGTNDVDYSVCLFDGIELLDGVVDSFIFTRACERNGKNTVVFRTVKNGNTMHYYDVSNDKP